LRPTVRSEAPHAIVLGEHPGILDLGASRASCLETEIVNNLKTTGSRLIRRDFSDHLKGVYRKSGVLVPLVLHHLVRRSPLAIIKLRTAGKSGLSRGVFRHQRRRAGWSARRRSGRVSTRKLRSAVLSQETPPWT
jgi:hypothetical protein